MDAIGIEIRAHITNRQSSVFLPSDCTGTRCGWACTMSTVESSLNVTVITSFLCYIEGIKNISLPSHGSKKHSEKLKKVKNSGIQASYVHVHFRLVHKPR